MSAPERLVGSDAYGHASGPSHARIGVDAQRLAGSKRRSSEMVSGALFAHFLKRRQILAPAPAVCDGFVPGQKSPEEQALVSLPGTAAHKYAGSLSGVPLPTNHEPVIGVAASRMQVRNGSDCATDFTLPMKHGQLDQASSLLPRALPPRPPQQLLPQQQVQEQQQQQQQQQQGQRKQEHEQLQLHHQFRIPHPPQSAFQQCFDRALPVPLELQPLMPHRHMQQQQQHHEQHWLEQRLQIPHQSWNALGQHQRAAVAEIKSPKDLAFKCPSCLLSFARKPDLYRHVRTVHLGLKRFACPSCGRLFGTSGNMRKHVRNIHTADGHDENGTTVTATTGYISDRNGEQSGTCSDAAEKILAGTITGSGSGSGTGSGGVGKGGGSTPTDTGTNSGSGSEDPSTEECEKG